MALRGATGRGCSPRATGCRHQGGLASARPCRQRPRDVKHQLSWCCLAQFSRICLWNGEAFWCEHSASLYLKGCQFVQSAGAILSSKPPQPLGRRACVISAGGHSLHLLFARLEKASLAASGYAHHSYRLSGPRDSTFLLLEAVL